MNSQVQSRWEFAANTSELRGSGSMVARIDGKQIALFDTENGIRACDNRCPHEGYPLSEGSLGVDCRLTCNWHNWKFDLNTGDNLLGGDRLRIYPVEVRGEEIWVDIQEPPFEERYESITTSLREAFDDHEYDRIAREIARLIKLGADPLDTLRLAIHWSWNRMEFGWTHAYAGMADWLSLYEENDGDREIQLVCLTEPVAHCAYDTLRERAYPYTDKVSEFREEAFLDAVEQEDEDLAVSMIRGGLKDGLGYEDFEPALTRAALAHYNDFGHSLIYVTKAGELIRKLGDGVAEPLLLSLLREIVYATREDRIPEFRRYESALAAWGDGGDGDPKTDLWLGKGINSALDTALKYSSSAPEKLYQALLMANAVNMLSFDITQQDKVHVTISGNVGWLDFTHGLTFANAVRKQCTRYPDQWPRGLLQMACFSGRNAAFTVPECDSDQWRPGKDGHDLKTLIDKVLDHGQGEHIVSVHLLKTAMAVREEARLIPEKHAAILAAALNRFFNSPLKRRQTRRTAHQSIQFVDRE